MHFIHATSGGRESKLQKRNMDMIILVTSKCRERERERERVTWYKMAISWVRRQCPDDECS
jgi:hypothetical protein